MESPVFFQPAAGWVGDVIPFQEDGHFRLFYLHELRDVPKPGTSWNLVTTNDLVTFHDDGVALSHGDNDAADFNMYTGSFIRDGGTHHVFYTGQNPLDLGADGAPLQLIMHATSTDGMETWQKHPEHTFGASAGYETGDWRDPFVFFDGGASLWRMLLAARHTDGPERRRGVIAQLTSTDLITWSPTQPFWDPRRYITHECPDVFQWGDWWYLVYSEFSESFTTHYRMAKSLDGPWLVPPQDTIDGRAFYASKSAERDGRRFFFGWIASKDGRRDDGAWQWAGTMSTLEATQAPDGTLRFKFASELVDSFDSVAEVTVALPSLSEIDVPDGYRAILSEEDLPDQAYIRAEFDIAPGTTECGLLLRASADGDESYIVRLEPGKSRMVFDRWPRKATGEMQWQVSGDVPFAIELERPCDLTPGVHTLEVILEGDICVAVVDRRVALSTRIYDRPRGRLGVFVGEGAAVIRELKVLVRSNN